MRRLGLVPPLLFLLAACGGGGDEPATEKGPEYRVLAELASAADCSGSLSKDPEPMMYAASSGSCTLPGGGDVSLILFNNDTARDKFVKTGIGNGAAYVVGPGWAVESMSLTDRDAAAESTGGTKRG